MRLKIGVRSLLHRKVQCEVITLVVVMCLFLSMVVWQPFSVCWRYIITRVSEMHVAYHSCVPSCVLFTSAEQTTFNISYNFTIYSFLPSCLPYLHHRMCVWGGENNDKYRKRLKIGVRSLLHRKVKCQPASCCHVFVPQYGCLAAIYVLLALYHCACLRNARRISYGDSDCGIFTSAEQTSNNPSHIP
jgi:hypothetical protein